MKHKSIVENVAKIIFTVCAVVAIFAVLSITIYMFLKGAPAFLKVGVLNLLFGTKWAPTAADPSYGILYIILTSIIGTAVSILIGVPIALLTAVFLTEVSNKKALSGSAAGSRAACSHSISNLWTFRTYDT